MSKLIEIARELGNATDKLTFQSPVAYVYNPLIYAREPHENYLRRYGIGQKEAILLGMNPGPFGMAQTGVPFGSVSLVRDWLGITGQVAAPAKQHPKRPILGFDCQREEVSGQRLWGWARDRFVRPERFFERFFVWNYCPLAFMEASGKNRTPDKLHSAERTALYARCDQALAALVDTLKPRWLLGVGGFAAKQAAALQRPGLTIGQVLHPSPASPIANRGWSAQIEKQMLDLGIDLKKSKRREAPIFGAPLDGKSTSVSFS